MDPIISVDPSNFVWKQNHNIILEIQLRHHILYRANDEQFYTHPM